MTHRLKLLIALIPALVIGLPAQAAQVHPDLASWMEGADLDAVRDVIVQLEDGFKGSDVSDLFGNARLHQEFKKLGMASVEVTPPVLQDLADDPRVFAISPDSSVRMLARGGKGTSGSSAAGPEASEFSLLQQVTGADQATAALGVTGNGIGIAVLDSGTADHSDFRLEEDVVVRVPGANSDGWDRYGHGTHVAGIALGSGQASQSLGYDYSGIAPDAKFYSVMVLDDTGNGQVSWVLAGIDWVLNNSRKIQVVNLSLGMPAVESYLTDPLCQATKQLHDAGIVTVVAAGNYGISPTGETAYGSITSPGNSPWVITVGAVNDQGTPQRSDDTVATYSSRGPTRSFDATSGLYDHLLKPDVVATGNRVVGPAAADNWIVTNYPEFNIEDSNTNKSYMFLNGTSMATPVVTGTAALMLQANPDLTPSMVKAILMYTAQTLPGYSVFDQGSGHVNAEGAVRLASAITVPRNTDPGEVLLDPADMPAQVSTLSGETVPWSQGYVMLLDDLGNLVQAGGILFAERVLFSEGIVFAEGILFAEMGVRGHGVIFAERSLFSQGVIFAERGVPTMTPDGMVDATGVIFAEGGTLGYGMLVDSMGVIFAERSLFAQGVIFAERGTSTSEPGLNFAGQSALDSEDEFAQGILFAERELPGLHTSSNNVLVAGEAFIYE